MILSPRAIEAAAKHIYEDKGDRKGIIYAGWDNEPESIKEPWRVDVTAAVTAYLAARKEEGFMEVPREPTPHQISAALPTDCRSSVDYVAKKIGAAAVMQLVGGKSLPTEGELVLQAAYLVQDYRAMITAAQSGGEDAGK